LITKAFYVALIAKLPNSAELTESQAREKLCNINTLQQKNQFV
jgi:hypothetical protein